MCYNKTTYQTKGVVSMAVVKYHNELNKVVLTRLDAKETDIFYSIIYKMKEQETATFSTHEIKSFMTGERSDLRFFEGLQNVFKTQLRVYKGSKITDYHLFIKKELDLEKKEISMRLNPECHHILNGLIENYTSFQLAELISLRGEYPKKLFRLLMQFKDTGKATFEIDRFRVLLEIPVNYKQSNIDQKVLKPCLKELGSIFINLKYSKLRKKSNKKFISHIEFTWKKIPLVRQKTIYEQIETIEKKQPQDEEVTQPKEQNPDVKVLLDLCKEQSEEVEKIIARNIEKHSFEMIKSNILKANEKSTKDNGFEGYLVSALRSDYAAGDRKKLQRAKKKQENQRKKQEEKEKNKKKFEEFLNKFAESISFELEFDKAMDLDELYEKRKKYFKGTRAEFITQEIKAELNEALEDAISNNAIEFQNYDEYQEYLKFYADQQYNL